MTGGITSRPFSLFHFRESRQKPDVSCSCAIWAGVPSAVTIHSLLPNVQFHFRKHLIFYWVRLRLCSSVPVAVDCRWNKNSSTVAAFPHFPLCNVNCCGGLQTLEAFTQCHSAISGSTKLLGQNGIVQFMLLFLPMLPPSIHASIKAEWWYDWLLILFDLFQLHIVKPFTSR